MAAVEAESIYFTLTNPQCPKSQPAVLPYTFGVASCENAFFHCASQPTETPSI